MNHTMPGGNTDPKLEVTKQISRWYYQPVKSETIPSDPLLSESEICLPTAGVRRRLRRTSIVMVLLTMSMECRCVLL